MISLYRKLSFYSLLLFSGQIYCADFTAEIDGDNITWLNAIQINGYLTTAIWHNPGGLPPTIEWSGGSFLTEPPSDVNLTSASGESVNIPISIAGMEYKLSNAKSFDRTGEVPPSINPCRGGSYTFNTSSGVKVFGTKCVSPISFVGSEAYTPFHFARPLIEIDKTELLTKFRDANVSRGTYYGVVFFTPAYVYKSQGGAWTYRQFNSVPLSINIIYEPAFLDTVTVSGDKKLKTSYNEATNYMSGEATVNIIANGFFSSGLRMSLSKIRSEEDYALKHNDPNIDSIIPYTIKCNKCEGGPLLVKDGKLLNGSSTIIPGRSRQIKFDLGVSFSVDQRKIENGPHSDTVQLTFEVNL